MKTINKGNIVCKNISRFLFLLSILIKFSSQEYVFSQAMGECDGNDGVGVLGTGTKVNGNPGYAPFSGGAGVSFIYILTDETIQIRTTDGLRIQTVYKEHSGKFRDMAADHEGRLLVSGFAENEITVFDKLGERIGKLDREFIVPALIVSDKMNNTYILNSDGKEIIMLDPTGNYLETISSPSKITRLDLNSDQSTIYYISEKGEVLSLNLIPSGEKFDAFKSDVNAAKDLKILSNGDILVANEINIVRLDPSGKLVQSYDAPGHDNWDKLVLDPDGKTFWCIDHINSNLWQFEIATGNLLSHFNFNKGPQIINGLAIIGPESKSFTLTNAILNLKLNFEGIPVNNETVSVTLRNANSPHEIIDVKEGILDPDGNCSPLNFSNVIQGNSYYLTIKHRNSIETWSSSGINFDESPVNYDFTKSIYEAYGDNMTLVNDKASIFSGDQNQDGIIDGTDLALADNARHNLVQKDELILDLDRDYQTSETDFEIINNNALNFINSIIP